MNLQAAVSALAEIPGKVAEALRGASALAEKNATLSAENAALASKNAELAASLKTLTEAAAQAKASADSVASEKAASDAEVQRLKAEAKTADEIAETKAKALLAAQGTKPVTDKSGGNAAGAHVGPDGKPLTGLALALAIHTANAAKAAETQVA